MTPLLCRKKRYFSTTSMLRDRYFGFPPLHKKANKVLQGGDRSVFKCFLWICLKVLCQNQIPHLFKFDQECNHLFAYSSRSNKSGWPSGPRRQTQGWLSFPVINWVSVLVSDWRRGFESHSWQNVKLKGLFFRWSWKENKDWEEFDVGDVLLITQKYIYF